MALRGRRWSSPRSRARSKNALLARAARAPTGAETWARHTASQMVASSSPLVAELPGPVEWYRPLHGVPSLQVLQQKSWPCQRSQRQPCLRLPHARKARNCALARPSAVTWTRKMSGRTWFPAHVVAAWLLETGWRGCHPVPTGIRQSSVGSSCRPSESRATTKCPEGDRGQRTTHSRRPAMKAAAETRSLQPLEWR